MRHGSILTRAARHCEARSLTAERRAGQPRGASSVAFLSRAVATKPGFSHPALMIIQNCPQIREPAPSITPVPYPAIIDHGDI
jgi:hypothetical protein